MPFPEDMEPVSGVKLITDNKRRDFEPDEAPPPSLGIPRNFVQEIFSAKFRRYTNYEFVKICRFTKYKFSPRHINFMKCLRFANLRMT